MNESATERVYLRMLEAVGARAGDIGPGIIAAHWPFVGSAYQGLVVVGQALQGWDAQETPARWTAAEATTPEGRQSRPVSSQLDPFTERIAAMLAADPIVRATVIRERLRVDGYRGGITILKDHLARVRPRFLASRAFQRTSYQPGEIGQVDWWHTGVRVPVGRGVSREAFGLVATLPFSAAHAMTFSLSRTVGDLRPGLVGCLERLGGVPEKLVFDNDASVVATGSGSRARLHDEVTGLLGALRTKAVVLRPARPTSKGNVERTIGCAETSFLPLRDFASLDDLQDQHDAWAAEVAYRRHIRRLGGTVAQRLVAERGFLGPLPDPLPDTDLHLEARPASTPSSACSAPTTRSRPARPRGARPTARGSRRRASEQRLRDCLPEREGRRHRPGHRPDREPRFRSRERTDTG
jgi:transposase